MITKVLLKLKLSAFNLAGTNLDGRTKTEMGIPVPTYLSGWLSVPMFAKEASTTKYSKPKVSNNQNASSQTWFRLWTDTSDVQRIDKVLLQLARSEIAHQRWMYSFFCAPEVAGRHQPTTEISALSPRCRLILSRSLLDLEVIARRTLATQE